MRMRARVIMKAYSDSEWEKRMKKVIHIFGASGSGTTTLARAATERFGWRFMDTDDYFWLPTDPMYTVKRPVDERLAMMRRDIEKEGDVVISGSLCGWGDELIPYFTLCIRLSAETAVRIERLRKREREKFGARLDEGGDMYEAHLKFLDWAGRYDDGGEHMRSRKNHDLWQEKLSCPVISLNGTNIIEENLEIIKKSM